MNKSFLPTALSCLADYSWPGNIREMENTIQRIMINSRNEAITEVDVMANLTYDQENRHPAPGFQSHSMKTTLEETEYQILKEAKERFRSTREMAKFLNMSQATLIRRLKK